MQHLQPIIEIQQYIKYFCHKQCNICHIYCPSLIDFMTWSNHIISLFTSETLKKYCSVIQFEKTNTKHFSHGLLFSSFKFLFNKECNVRSLHLANYSKSWAHSCETNSFYDFHYTLLRKKRPNTNL